MDTQKDTTQISQDRKLEGFGFFVLKTERLTSALYLVTSLLSDSEPLKWRLRESALEVLSDIKLVSTEELANGDQTFVFYKNIDLESFRRDVADILSLLTISLDSGTVSTMNLSLLRNEYETLAKGVTEMIGRSMQSFVLSGYQTEDILPSRTSHNLSAPKLSDSYISNPKSKLSISSGSEDKRQSFPKPTSTVSDDTESVAKNERQEKIKTFLKDKGWVSIKDISEIAPECSVKTIQRDLAVMVDRGVLKKKGDRRWSRYALVS